MITIRKSEDRGQADQGWLKAKFTFSFAGYYDPDFVGFHTLRVMNEDRISPGKGFGPHAHRDMEIISYILKGNLSHRDNMGEEHTIGPNEIQAMSAGNGIVHSEYNESGSEPIRMMQIWIEPKSEDLTPSYQQVAFSPEEKRGRLRLLAGPDVGGDDCVFINQDVRLFVTELGEGESVEHALEPERHAWVQVVRGEGSLNGQTLRQGDGAAISDESRLSIEGSGAEGGEILVFDLPSD